MQSDHCGFDLPRLKLRKPRRSANARDADAFWLSRNLRKGVGT